MKKNINCIVCPRGCRLNAEAGNTIKITGNACSRGEIYGRQEILCPMRILTTTIACCFTSAAGKTVSMRLPVKTGCEIPLEQVSEAIAKIRKIVVNKKVCCGEKLAEIQLNATKNSPAAKNSSRPIITPIIATASTEELL